MRLLVALVAVVCLVSPGSASAWSWPASGDVLRGFSLGDDPYAPGQHRGVDIAGPRGSELRAPVEGTVTFAGTVGANGKTVTIATADGYSVTLVHLGGIAVSKGVAVDEGDAVGSIGPSGEAEHDQPYVHLGVRRTADPQGYLDPLGFLPQRGGVSEPPAPPPTPAPAPAPQPQPAPQPAPHKPQPQPSHSHSHSHSHSPSLSRNRRRHPRLRFSPSRLRRRKPGRRPCRSQRSRRRR